jgi:integrase
VRRVIKRREWLLSRLCVGLPIFEDDQRQLGKFFEDWLDSREVTKSTRSSDASLWKNYWADWYSYTPASITTTMVKARLAERDVSPKTKRNALSVLSAVLNYAEVNPNPCAPIRIKRGQKAPVVRYRPAELDAVLAKLKGEALVYFTLLAATGLRPSEALALEWSDWDGERLDVSKGIVRRRLRTSTKTHTRRRVYVPTWARDAINQHVTRFAGGYIFQNTLGNYHCDPDDFNSAWRKAHQKARIPYRHPYTLRHTRAAELLSTGSSDYASFAKEMGHSVEMFLRTYSEVIDEYKQINTDVLEGIRAKRKPNERNAG